MRHGWRGGQRRADRRGYGAEPPGCAGIGVLLGGSIGALVAGIARLVVALLGTGTVGHREWLEGADVHDREEPVRDEPEPAAVERAGAAESDRSAIIVIALSAGLGLGLALSLTLARSALDWSVHGVVPPLIGLAAGALVYALLHRLTAESSSGQGDRTVRRQVSRIRGKARGLCREARRAGGVYGNIDWQAPELARRAEELAETLFRLRRAARGIRREEANPVIPQGVGEPRRDEELQREFDAARAAHERLEQLMESNERYQQICLTQIERIEDLLDAARLQISQPVEAPAQAGPGSELVEQFDLELSAAREALAEVQQENA